jgi:hypothetical protein
MHYNLLNGAPSFRSQPRDAGSQNPAGGAPPAGVEQSDSTPGRHEIDRDAIGDGHGEQDPRLSGDPRIYPVDLDPAAPTVYAADLDAMNLIA